MSFERPFLLTGTKRYLKSKWRLCFWITCVKALATDELTDREVNTYVPPEKTEDVGNQLASKAGMYLRSMVANAPGGIIVRVHA